MSSNLRDFKAKVRRWADERPKLALRIARRKIALDLLRGIIELTPVDTGRARGGWNVTADVISDEETGRLDTNGRATIDAGRGVINAAPTLGILYIQNAVRYARFLEEGTPRMAPFAMITRSLARVGSVFA